MIKTLNAMIQKIITQIENLRSTFIFSKHVIVKNEFLYNLFYLV